MKKIALMFAVALSAGSAWAEGSWPCKQDAEAVCQDVKPGGGRIVDCLKSHEDALSSACREHMGQKREEAKKEMSECADDKEKFCKDVTPGEGRIIECMKAHEAELSAACRDGLAEKREHAKKEMGGCAADKEKFCKDVKPGEGRIIACMKTHEAELSETCRASLAEKKENRREKREMRKERKGGAE